MKAAVVIGVAALASACTAPHSPAPDIVRANASTQATAAPVSHWARGAGDVRLHYLDFGGRGAPVILLSGAGNSAWIYTDFAKELARDHRVYALTRRGHGDSGYPQDGYDLDTLGEDLRLFMEQRGLTRAALIGHSLAGAELTHFATRLPDRVAALIYLDAAYDRSTQMKATESDPISTEPASDADRASKSSFIDYVRRTRPDLARYWTDAVERDLRASIGARPEGGFGWRTTGAIFGQLFSGAAAAPPDYSKIQAPSLAIYSVEDEDYRLPPNASASLKASLDAFEEGPLAAWRNESMRQFRQGAKKGSVVEMDAGHHLFLHRPDQTLKLVRTFLREQR